MEHQTAGTRLDAGLRQRVLDGIAVVLPHVLEGRVQVVAEDTRLADLNLQSATTLEFMLELESEVDIQIDVEDITAEDMTTIGTLTDYIVSHVVTLG